MGRSDRRSKLGFVIFAFKMEMAALSLL